MQALYLEIKNLIISTLTLDELSADDIDTDAALFGDTAKKSHDRYAHRC